MSREAMKELVRAREQCKDEAVGSWLAYYEQGRLDKKRRASFVEHLGECLHCMALYNIGTKHRYGYIDAERTRARRVKVTLLEWLPPRRHILAALSVWVLVLSFTTFQTRRLSPQEPRQEFGKQSPQLGTLPSSPSPSPEPTNTTSTLALRQAGKGRDLGSRTGRARLNAPGPGNVAIEQVNPPPNVQPAFVPKSSGETEQRAEGEVSSDNHQPERKVEEVAPRVAPPVELNGAGLEPPKHISLGTQSYDNGKAGVSDKDQEENFTILREELKVAEKIYGKAGS